MLGATVRRGECFLLDWRRSSDSANVSSLMRGGTGISIHSERGDSWLALFREATPPRSRIGRVTRMRGEIRVLPKQAAPL